jgi:c-di-GMP-binding flagellar brake protein YcgR
MVKGDDSVRQELLNMGESLLIPSGTQVQLEIDGIPAKLRSHSVGCLPEGCLIFRYPTMTHPGAIAHKLFKGNKISLQYMDKGNVFTFRTELLGFITEPVKLIFLAYPSEITRQNLRNVARTSCSLIAEVDVNGEKFEGIITDISETGGRISITAQWADQLLPAMRINQAFLILCRLPGIEDPVEIVGQVRNFQSEIQRITIGTFFHGVDPAVCAAIINFVMTVQKIR